MVNFIDFNLMNLVTGDIGNSAGVFTGENVQYGWRSSSKANIAMGKICGDYNRIVGGRQEIVDPDYVDTYVQKPHPFTGLMPPSPTLLEVLEKRKHGLKVRRTDEWDW